MARKPESKIPEWDSELPPNNRFDDWPLDTKISISPELQEQMSDSPAPLTYCDPKEE